MVRPGAELAIELREVTVREGDRALLDGVDLAVPLGRSCAVVGSNGSGKSALVRVVAGLCRPSHGRVRVGGWDMFEHPDRGRGLIGYAADEPGLADRLTPREHLELAAAQRGLGRSDRQAAAESMLELVDLAGQRGTYAAALSRGQRRRLALALALVHDPPIILLDEPLAGIDDVGRGELGSVLLELRAMGKTLLIASQAAADVAEVCDVVAPLVGGRIGSPAERDAAVLTWIEIVGEPALAVRALREQPGIDDVRQEESFVTFRGPTTAEERAHLVEWLLRTGVRLSGFGVTGSPAGGESTT